MSEEIVCFTAYYKSQEGNANTSFAIRGCKNSGNLSSATTNGYIGGILGVDGFIENSDGSFRLREQRGIFPLQNPG